MARELRRGYTTGTCAAAAARAAAARLRGDSPSEVDVRLPDGDRVTLPVSSCESVRPGHARAAVVKDAGDDPDVTDGMTVWADVELLEPEHCPTSGRGTAERAGGEGADALIRNDDGVRVVIRGGEGVGVVTREGLQVPVGEPAVNPVPREMIVEAVRAELRGRSCRVTISVPGGREVAQRTFNPRLGIEGGISILGTSGRVIPRSEDAWKRSLLPQVDMALADGHTTVYLTPGRFGERAARDHLGAPETALVQCANFIGYLLDACAERGVEQIVLVGHAGKVVKVAAGLFDTNSRVGDARLETTAALAAAAGAPASVVGRLLDLPTVEAAVTLLRDAGLDDVWDDVARRAAARATERAARAAAAAGRRAPAVRCVLTDYSAAIIGDSARSAHGETGLITVVGVGPGTEEWLTPAAWRALRTAQVVAGGTRQLERFAPPAAERLVMGADVAAFAAELRRRLDRRLVVLASGDPTCYGVVATLRRELPDVPLRVVPGISSVQVALARLQVPWHEVRLASAHGQSADGVLAAVRESPRVLVLTDRHNSPAALAEALARAGLRARLTVLERLGYPDERITHGDPAAIAAGSFDPLSLLYVDREKAAP